MRHIIFGENKNIIGATIQNRRRSVGLSQADLAAKMQTMNVNIDQQMISRIEHNCRQVTDYEFACFCLCLNISPAEMLESFYKSIQDAN